MNATSQALSDALFDTVPPLSVSVPVTPAEGEELPPHPLDFAIDLKGCLHVFSIDSDIKSVKYVRPRLREVAIVAYLMKNPAATTVDVCRFFKCGPGVVQAVMKSDIFKHKLAEAQIALLESKDYLSLQNELSAGAIIATEIVNQKMLESGDPELALKAVSVYTKAMGMGVSKGGTNININQPVATADMLRSAREANVIDVEVVDSEGNSVAVSAGVSYLSNNEPAFCEPVVNFDDALFAIEGEELVKALDSFEEVVPA